MSTRWAIDNLVYVNMGTQKRRNSFKKIIEHRGVDAAIRKLVKMRNDLIAARGQHPKKFTEYDERIRLVTEDLEWMRARRSTKS